jgi:hypothetical protein
MTYPKMTKQQLLQEILSLKAQMYQSSYFASEELNKCSRDNMMGSAVILKVETLSGRAIVEPVAIQNGLSDASITAIKEDLKYTQEMKKDLVCK